MGDAKRRRKKAEPFEPPIADEGEITTTTLYPTIEAAWREEVVAQPFFDKYSRVFQRALRDAFYIGAAEMLRTVQFRSNADQDFRIFAELSKEIDAENAKRQRDLAELFAERH